MRKLRNILFVQLFFFFGNSVLVNAQLTQTPRMTTGGSGYLEYLPPDYATNPSRKYPILFFLHGTGETGSGSPSDLNKVKNAGPPQKIQGGHNMCFTVNGVEECFIVISPQLGPSKGGWWPNIQGEIFDYVLNGPHNYRIDRNRIYLTGLSLGGQGVYMGAGDSNLPDIFAAASPIAAFANGNGCNISARKIPMWGFHGQSDGTIQYGAGWTEFHRILWCTTPLPTAEYIWTPYPGVGHNAWDNAFRTDHSLHNPNLYEWLLSKSKSTLPQARAGVDITMTLPTNSTNIVGSGTDAGGSIASYAWTQLDGAAAVLTNITSATVSVSGLTAGVFNFRLTVIDNEGNSATDDVKVTVYPEAVNLPPTVTTGSDITITLPTNSTNIVATASDNDGSIANYAWIQETGPNNATLSGASSATLSVSGLIQGTYSFRITVRDDDNATATSLRNVIVNPMAVNLPPTVNAGGDKTVNLPTNSTNITCTAADPEGGVLTYLWERTGGPAATLININSATLTANSLVAGLYIFRITVTDNKGVTATDDVNVNVVAANQAPSANANGDIAITLPTNSTNITGSGADADGSIISYAWTQLPGGPNTATLTNATSTTVTAANLIVGVYNFRLTVTDNNSATATDDVKVTVGAIPVNPPPTAYGGIDKTITLPLNTVTLNGSGTDNGSIASYNWIKFAGPTAVLTNQNTANLTASSLIAGAYIFRLTVTDNLGETAYHDVNVVVQPEVVNQSPVADAGSDALVILPITQTTINGAGSDNDGTIATYSWSQVGGAAASLTGQNTASLQVTGLALGSYFFRLTVTDNRGASHFDEVKITVTSTNTKPTANAGDDIFINLPTTTTVVNGGGVDVDGTIVSYAWSLVTGAATLTNETTSSVSVSGLAAGVYNLRLTVTDNGGEIGTDEVKITVNSIDLAPTALAGDNKSITLPTNSINLTGSGTDPEGPVVAYLWEKLTGPSATLTNPNNSVVTVTVTVQGTYVFRLTVTDNGGNTDFDDVELVVNAATVPRPPTANAGTNQTLTLPLNSTQLQGSGTDPDGAIASYQWIKFSGPAAVLTNENTSVVSVSSLIEGTYVFRLTVTDNSGLTATSDVTVNVFPQTVNQTPTANAEGNKALTLPTNSITLFGSGSDADGIITTYAWTKLEGPAATLINATTPNLSLTGLVEGAYVFRLTVTDNNLATGTDDVILTVNAIGNQLPVSNAGPDRIIILPTTSATLAGSGSDGDGSINNYLWEILGGPSATLTNSSKPNLSISDLIEGTYTIALTVTDNAGNTHTDEMSLLVLAAGVNQTPSVSAGADIALILPKNNTLLRGSASDPDGTVVSYAWTQISGGPSTMTDIATPNLLLTNMVADRYVYRLTVTDDDGSIGSDEITVDVFPEGTNSPPIANAGPDLSLKLPTNSILINGVGNDSDGTIVTYAWTKVGGPPAILTNTATQTLSVSGLIEGTYTLRLSVTDDDGVSATADVNIVVLPANFNQSPVANAGGNVFLTLPENATTLNGSGTDPDGTIASYLWSKRAGPTTVTESGNATPALSLSGLVAGTYVYRITVTDNTGGTAFDETIITVVDENTQVQNDAPEANAGEDQIIPTGTVSTRLIGTYEDSGLIDRVSWSQLSGSEIVLNGVDNDTLLVTNLTKGTYLFDFTVIDALNVSDSDEVMVTVSDHIEVNSKIFFSPNGDGQNDVWVLDPDTTKIENCKLVIFNSRGTKVFEAAPYQNNWNGTHNGQALPEDVYYYVLNCGGGKNSGSITILR
jgi:gliding motility-associated-like protein